MTRRIRFENGQKTELEAPARWVCRAGFGCEGSGRLHFTFLNDPERS